MAFTVGLIVDKVAFENGAIAELQLAKALPDIHRPVSFVELFAEVTAAISDFSVTVLFTTEEFADELGAVVIGSRSLSIDLSILKHASKLATITHQKHAFACLPAAIEGALILEVWVSVCVASLAMSQLRNWVDGAHISIFGHFVLEITFSECGWCLHLRMVLVECSRVSRIVLLTN